MFRNDYSESAHEDILRAVMVLSTEQNIGYGEDVHTEHAKELIRNYFGVPEADVHLLAGGTVTNMTVISYFLKPYEAVIACDTGHINVHETGAVEASGHKVLTCPAADGKLLAADVEKTVLLHCDEHMVRPAMVYISDATETGSLYTAKELKELREVCDMYGLILYLDGARLACALASHYGGVTAELIGRVCDVFYAGGTKNGLLFGEAVVIKNKALSGLFRYHIKNRGAMLAKGFVTGAQFEALFTDDLYTRLASNSLSTAKIIKTGLKELGVTFYGDSPTNQIFLVLPPEKADALTEKYGCERWKDIDTGRVVRIVTSFATKKDECEELLAFIRSIL